MTLLEHAVVKTGAHKAPFAATPNGHLLAFLQRGKRRGAFELGADADKIVLHGEHHADRNQDDEADEHQQLDRRLAGLRPTTRGGVGRKRRDYCPEHAPIELARVAELKRKKEERKKLRAEARDARRALKAAAKAEAAT